MMGRKYREQANFFYEFRLDDMIGALVAPDQCFRDICARRLARTVGSILQRHRPTFDRSRVADPDAYRWLLLGHSLREEAVRGSKTPPRIQVVLPARSQCRDSPPLYVLREPVEPVP